MKIENNGITPLSPKKIEESYRAEKKDGAQNAHAVSGGRDKAELSENARLLAKARLALDHVEERDVDRLEDLRRQIENGEYKVPVEELAKKLVSRLFPET